MDITELSVYISKMLEGSNENTSNIELLLHKISQVDAGAGGNTMEELLASSLISNQNLLSIIDQNNDSIIPAINETLTHLAFLRQELKGHLIQLSQPNLYNIDFATTGINTGFLTMREFEIIDFVETPTGNVYSFDITSSNITLDNNIVRIVGNKHDISMNKDNVYNYNGNTNDVNQTPLFDSIIQTIRI